MKLLDPKSTDTADLLAVIRELSDRISQLEDAVDGAIGQLTDAITGLAGARTARPDRKNGKRKEDTAA